jgi:hypothetical protein
VLHHHHAVADPGHNVEVVGDDHHGAAARQAQAPDQVQHLRLGGLVERRGRFVEHQERGIAGQRAGEHDTLALPARKLVRIPPREAFRIGQPHLREQFERPQASGVPSQTGAAPQHLLHLRARAHVEGQRGERVLRDHRHLAPAQIGQGGGRQRRQVAAAEQDGA